MHKIVEVAIIRVVQTAARSYHRQSFPRLETRGQVLRPILTTWKLWGIFFFFFSRRGHSNSAIIRTWLAVQSTSLGVKSWIVLSFLLEINYVLMHYILAAFSLPPLLWGAPSPTISLLPQIHFPSISFSTGGGRWKQYFQSFNSQSNKNEMTPEIFHPLETGRPQVKRLHGEGLLTGGDAVKRRGAT